MWMRWERVWRGVRVGDDRVVVREVLEVDSEPELEEEGRG